MCAGQAALYLLRYLFMGKPSFAHEQILLEILIFRQDEDWVKK